MPRPSLARNFFEQIRNAPDRVAFIRNLYNPPSAMSESDWLDFKQPPRTGPTTQADLKDGQWLKIWMEALTGFANNQGGVLIWGIDARKDPATNIDAACGEAPVVNPEAVRSRLVELQRQATDPPMANVEIEAYTLPSAADRGFVVCFVPEGAFKPYREASGRSQYVYRVGDNFSIMPRSMLQSLFYPRSKAIFRVMAKLIWKADAVSHDLAHLGLAVDLANDGTATARECFVVVHFNMVGNTQPLSFVSNLWSMAQFHGEVELRATRPLHPTRNTPLFMAEWDVKMKRWPEPELGHASNFMFIPDCPPSSFSLAIFCENQERQNITVDFDMNELIDKHECVREAKPAE